MKKAVFLAALLTLAAGAAQGASYIGLYADPAHLVCQMRTLQYVPFDCYVFMINSDGTGIKGAEYKVVFPSGYIIAFTVANPDITVILRDPFCGTILTFETCWMDWVWSHKFTCISLIEPAPAVITVEGNPDDYYLLQIVSCEPGLPAYPLTILNPLFLNSFGSGCEIAVEESSWGAIKSLF